MAIRTVQLTTDDIDPQTGVRPFYDVDEGEYERLLDLGIVVNAPADPEPVDLFDTEVAALLTDPTSAAHAAGVAEFVSGGAPVSSVNTKTGDVVLTADDIND